MKSISKRSLLKNGNKLFVSFISFLLLTVILLNVGIASSSSLASENPVSKYPFKQITYTYRDSVRDKKKGNNTNNDVVTEYFRYNDGFFLLDSKTLSGDIAKMSIALASSSYYLDYITEVFDQMGFTCDSSYNYSYVNTMTLGVNDLDHVAYSIWHKNIGDYRVYCVPIKGTSANAEWYSNFHLGQEDEYLSGENKNMHLGFQRAAEEVYSSLISTIDKNNTNNNYDYKHTIILTTGHSRGAAVSNILAGWLNNRTSIPEKQIFGYTFACPAVSLDADMSMENIYNFNNPGDLIPLLPLERWGYKRNGYSFGEGIYPNQNYKENTYQQFERITEKSCLSLDNPLGYLGTIDLFLSSPDSFNTPKMQFLFRCVSWALGGGKNRKNEWIAVAKIDGYNGCISALSEIPSDMSDLVNRICKSYNGEYQEAIDFIEFYEIDILKMSAKEFSTFKNENTSMINKIKKFSGSSLETPSSLVDAKTIISDKEEYTKAFVNESARVFNLFLKGGASLPDSVAHAHDPAFYISWINSLYFGNKGWYNNAAVSSFSSYEVPEVYSIGSSCFSGCTSLKNIELPESLQSIGYEAFYNCISIKKITIPSDVTDYGYRAFGNCLLLSDLTLPLTADFGDSSNYATFSGCSAISNICITGSGDMINASNIYNNSNYGHYLYAPWKISESKDLKVTISEGITSVGDYAFARTYNLANISLPSTITTIGVGSFNECSGIKGSINLPDGLTLIGEKAFNGCSGIEEVVIPDSISIIDGQAFRNCTGLQRLTIPFNYLYVSGEKRFEGCTSINYVKISGKGEMPNFDNNYNNSGDFPVSELPWHISEAEELEINLSEGIYRIGDNTFTGCENIVKVTIPNTVKTIGKYAFYNCNNLYSVTIPESVKSIDERAFECCSGLTDLTISCGALNGDVKYRFNGCTSIQNVNIIGSGEIPNAVDFPWTYSRDKKLNISISDGITSIGSGAFKGHSNLYEITIPESVNSIGDEAFMGCNNLSNVTLPSQLTYIGDHAFQSCISFTDVTIPKDVNHIGIHAFANCEELSNVTISEGVTTIGGFKNCVKLTNIDIPKSVTSIGNSAFNGCKKLKSISIPDNVTTIGDYAFADCEDITSIIIPEKVSTIGNHAFDGCESLVSISIPNSVHKICDGTFSSCYRLKQVTLLSGLTEIGENAFNCCWGLQRITIPKGVKSIGISAFNRCDNLKTIVIANSINSIGDKAFRECPKLSDVYFGSNEEEWNNIAIGTDNDNLINAQLHFENSGSHSVIICDFANGNVSVSKHFANANDTISINTIPDDGFGVYSITVNGNSITGSSFSMGECDAIVEVTFKRLYSITVRKWDDDPIFFHGSTEVSKTKAFEGEVISVIATPSMCYGVDHFALSYLLEYEKFTNNEFVMPAHDVALITSYKLLGHDLKLVEKTVSCTEDGHNAYYECSNCHRKFKDADGNDYIKELETIHKYGHLMEYKRLIPASNFKPGTIAHYRCYRCEKCFSDSDGNNELNQSDLIIPARLGEHNVEFVLGKAATCIEEGYKAYYICTDCGQLFDYEEPRIIDEPVKIPKEKHSINSVFEKAPTKDSEGNISHYKCSYCGKLFSDYQGQHEITLADTIIPKMIHDLTKVNHEYEGCTHDGNIEYYKCNDSECGCNKVFSDKYGQHEISISDTIIKATGHQPWRHPGWPATCVERGCIPHWTCLGDCGKLFLDKECTIEISFEDTHTPALGHQLTHVELKKPTCKENGNDEYWKCLRCDDCFKDSDGKQSIKSEDVIKPALGHHLILVKAKDPTKTEAGNIEYYKCDREGCGKLFKDAKGTQEITDPNDVIIPAIGHDLELVSKKDPTCTEPGNTAYYRCKDNDCDKLYRDKFGREEILLKDTVIPATGHNIIEVQEKAATCTEDGYEAHFKCSNCNKLFSDKDGKNEIDSPVVIPKLGHEWDEGEVTQAPSCETTGVKTLHCKHTGCKATTEETIPALGHDLEHLEYHKAKDPTRDNDGNIEYWICTRCNKYYTDPDCKNEIDPVKVILHAIGAADLGEEAEVDGLKYVVTNPSTDDTGTVSVIGKADPITSVSIPATIVYKETTYLVTKIASKAFYKDLTIKTLSIGPNVKSIDSNAFYGCKNLTKVSGGSKLETIGTSAFAYCSKLKNYSITSPVLKKIGSTAFNKDKKLKTIYIRNTTKLTKSGVKKSLKGSSVKTVKVKKSKVKKYKKYFTKKNCGRKVKVKK